MSLAVLVLVLVVGGRLAATAGAGVGVAERAPVGAGTIVEPGHGQGGRAAPDVGPDVEVGADRPATTMPAEGAPEKAPVDQGAPEPLDRGLDIAEPTAPDWWGVLAELDGLRSAALARGDQAGIDRYAEPGSPAWQADVALLGGLRARGLTPVGLTTTVVAIESAPAPGDGAEPGASPGATAGPAEGPGSAAGEPIPDPGGDLLAPDAGDGAVWLVVVDERSAYSLREATGSVREVPPAGLRRWRIQLVPAPAGGSGPGWLVRSVEPVP